jgi:nicotinamidase-related amidase
MPTRSHFPQARSALLLVDVINPFDFPGGAAFARRARRVARAIVRLRARATNAGIPVIYVNDNFGKWRSDASSLVKFGLRPGTPGAPIVEMLQPRKNPHRLRIRRRQLCAVYGRGCLYAGFSAGRSA